MNTVNNLSNVGTANVLPLLIPKTIAGVVRNLEMRFNGTLLWTKKVFIPNSEMFNAQRALNKTQGAFNYSLSPNVELVDCKPANVPYWDYII